jgi:hypothetical protein
MTTAATAQKRIFTLTSNARNVQLFHTLEDVLSRLNELSIIHNDKYSLFGRPYEIDPETGEIVERLSWVIDSATFAKQGGYITYYIQCFNAETLEKIDFEN